MSKKDYQAIAAALHTVKELAELSYEGEEVWQRILDELIPVLAADNPRFNRALFLEACETGHCKGMPKRAA